MDSEFFNITHDFVYTLISDQFPKYAHLPIISVEKQGHDNRTFRLGNDMLVRIPTMRCYATQIQKEYHLLPKLAPYLSVNIPTPMETSISSKYLPYPFSIYKWIEGTSLNLLTLDDYIHQQTAYDVAKFLKELHDIQDIKGPMPGEHSWWRGDHISVYDEEAHIQIKELNNIIDSDKALGLWKQACKTRWEKPFVWVHGDVAAGNIILSEDNRLNAVIDFSCTAQGDPACDLVIAWTFFYGKSRDIFINTISLDENTWLRARGWALWKASFELCIIEDKNSAEAIIQRRIIKDVC